MQSPSVQTHGWVDPAFSRYDPELAHALTEWLYADPSNNPTSHAKPEAWPRTGLVKIVNRSLNFTTLADGASSTQLFRPIGGKNTIAFARTATVEDGTISLNPDLVLYAQQKTDGFQEIESTTLSNLFGSGEWPSIFLVPERWYGNSDRNVTITNNTGSTANIRLCWSLATLDTGR